MSLPLRVPPSFAAYVDSILAYLQPRMHLSEYRISWKLVRQIRGAPGLRPIPGVGNHGYSAEVLIDRVYLTIDINISQFGHDLFRKGDYATLAGDLVHELAHAYTDELADCLEQRIRKTDKPALERLRQLNESSVERIARTIFLSIPNGVWMPRA